MEAAIAAGRHVDHRGDVVLHHLFVDGVPALVGQRGRSPVAARWIGIQVDADVAVLFNALHQLGNAGRGVHAGRLGQHGCWDEVVGEQLADTEAQLVADGSPGARCLEVTDVVRHKGGAGAEDGQVRAAFLHQAQLVGFDGLADFVVADLQGSHRRGLAWVLEAGDLQITPCA